MVVKKRNIFLGYLFSIVSFGLFQLFWVAKLSPSANVAGIKLLAAMLVLITVANIYWQFKYCKGFSEYIERKNNSMPWFFLMFFIPIVLPITTQLKSDKTADY